MTPDAPPPPPPDPAIGRATRVIAILGGCLSIATATLVTLSVLGRWLGFGSINGDFERARHGNDAATHAALDKVEARLADLAPILSVLPR